MSILNVAPENHDYDGLNENSSDTEKLDVVFKILQKSPPYIWLDYPKLFVSDENQKLFDAKLQNTKLVRTDTSKMNPTYTLNEDGILFLDKYDSYSNFIGQVEKQQTIQRAKEELKETLEMQKLRGEVDDITNRLLDYSSVKSRSVRSEYIAIVSALIAAITLIISMTR